MATVTRIPLSGSTSGRNIIVAATATPGTTIHTAVNTAGSIDEIWLWVTNTSSSPVKLTLENGGTTSPNDLIEQTIDAESGLMLILPGTVLNTGVILRAFAGTTNVLNITGYANRIVN
jgi:hypothetical protein